MNSFYQWLGEQHAQALEASNEAARLMREAVGGESFTEACARFEAANQACDELLAARRLVELYRRESVV